MSDSYKLFFRCDGRDCVPSAGSSRSRRILVIGADPTMAGLVSTCLKNLNCSLRLESSSKAGLEEARSGHYDLVILDWMRRGPHRLDQCRHLHDGSPTTPIIIVCASASRQECVAALEIGADDILRAPFDAAELLARVKALFRRIDVLTARREEPPDIITVDDFAIDVGRRDVTVAGRPVKLTAREFSLLARLAENQGRVYSRAQLLDLVWGYDHVGGEHTVASHINRLRRKIEPDPANPYYLRTVWGVGYKFVDRRSGGAGNGQRTLQRSQCTSRAKLLTL